MWKGHGDARCSPDNVARMTSRTSRVEVVPPGGNIAKLGIGYEDFLALRIECSSAITKARAKELAALYDGWRTRMEKESRKIAKEDGEELLPIRFDALAVSGTHAHGGASRFLSASQACSWLVRELVKIPGVVKVQFGEEDVPAEPKAAQIPQPRTSPAVEQVNALLAQALGDETKSDARVLGRISIRFTGDELASPSKVLAGLIDEAVALAGDVGSIWVRGTWGVFGSLEEVNQGRDFREKSGRALLDCIFADVKRMPKTVLEPRIVHLALSDGPRPERSRGMWESGSRTASSFGVVVRLEPKESRPRGGQLEVYVPLADLESTERREAWVAYGERAFAALHGSVGTLSLALWMEAIAPRDLPIELFARLPAVAIPRLVGSYAGGFSWPELSPA